VADESDEQVLTKLEHSDLDVSDLFLNTLVSNDAYVDSLLDLISISDLFDGNVEVVESGSGEADSVELNKNWDLFSVDESLAEDLGDEPVSTLWQ
jgi:hypothetical protein